MSRMAMITPESACDAAAPTLESIQKKYATVPNFFAGLANNGAALNAYLAFQETLGRDSRLSQVQREMISLAVANHNRCHYCVSAHSLAAKHAGLPPEAAQRAQRGQAENPQDQALLAFALGVLEHRGDLPDSLLAEARDAGLDDAALVEVTSWVAINSYSNWINNLIQPEIDFPLVPLA